MIGLWRGLIGIAGWQLAKFERELIKDRTDAGRVRAKARGVKFDRKSKLNPFQREQALARLSSGEMQAEVARTWRGSGDHQQTGLAAPIRGGRRACRKLKGRRR